MSEKSYSEPILNSNLSQFVLQASSDEAKEGIVCAGIISQALESPGIYAFGELLDVENVKNLNGGPHQPFYNLLSLFSRGTFKDYTTQWESAKLPSLTPCQLNKLRHLSIASLASRMSSIPYEMLSEELDIANVRELEDLIIEAVYAGVIRGTMDQEKKSLEITFAIGRDFKDEDLDFLRETLQEWNNSCESVLSAIEGQIQQSNEEKKGKQCHKKELQATIIKLKKDLNFTRGDDEEEFFIDNNKPSANTDGGDTDSKGKRLLQQFAHKKWRK